MVKTILAIWTISSKSSRTSTLKMVFKNWTFPEQTTTVSNHLNTQHLKSKIHLFVQFSNGLIMWLGRTIQKADIFNHEKDIFCPVLRPPFKNQTIRQPGMFGPFKYQTCLVFSWLLYLSFEDLTHKKSYPLPPSSLLWIIFSHTFIQFNCVKDFFTIVDESVDIHRLTALYWRFGKQRCF